MTRRRLPPVYNLAVLTFLAAPLLVVVVASFNESPFLSFPPEQLSLKWYANVLSSRDFLNSFQSSITIALLAVSIALAIGVPASLALYRFRFPGAALVRGLAMAPLTFPEVLLGLALLEFFVAVLELNLGLSTLVLGHVVITTPFVVQIVTSAFASFDVSVEEAAYTLGASPIRTFFTITLPMMRTAIFSAGLFAFIFSFDNVAISLFLSVPGQVTLPIRMFQYVETQYDPSVAAVSTMLIAFAGVALAIFARLGSLEQVFRVGR